MSEKKHECEHNLCHCLVAGSKQFCSADCREPAPDLESCQCAHDDCDHHHERINAGVFPYEPIPRKERCPLGKARMDRGRR